MTTRLSYLQVYEIAKFLESDALAHHDGQICTYKPEWDDHKVAQLFDVPLLSVRGMRVKIFGVTRTREESSVEKKIAHLQAQLAALKESLK